MAEITRVMGNLTGYAVRQYDSFSDQRTGEVKPGGTTMTASVRGTGERFGVDVRVADVDMWNRLMELPLGSPVEFVCELRTFKGKTTRHATSFDAVPA